MALISCLTGKKKMSSKRQQRRCRKCICNSCRNWQECFEANICRDNGNTAIRLRCPLKELYPDYPKRLGYEPARKNAASRCEAIK